MAVGGDVEGREGNGQGAGDLDEAGVRRGGGGGGRGERPAGSKVVEGYVSSYSPSWRSVWARSKADHYVQWSFADKGGMVDHVS